jgi:phosphatidylcholine synthase
VGTYALLLVQYPDPHPLVVAVSLAYLLYYVAVSGWLTARAARRRRLDRRAEEQAGSAAV